MAPATTERPTDATVSGRLNSNDTDQSSAPDLVTVQEAGGDDQVLSHQALDEDAPGTAGVYATQEPCAVPGGTHRGLQNFPAAGNFPAATPVKRRGKSMSRRSGQKGSIERSGKWYVVRWWMDVPGQYKRKHMRARVCPISGPGLLSKSERERRGGEIVAASCADTVEYFNKVVKQQPALVLTFSEQAQRWLEHLRTRKRKPVAPSTVEDADRTLRNWINPHIGHCPVGDVNNSALKRLVTIMCKGGLSPKTIENYVQIPKAVVASVVDDDGNQVYPRKWNHEFIDLPIVEESEQNTPSFSSEIMTGLAKYHRSREQMIFALSGAGGFRIGEVLGIEIDKHLSADCSTVTVKQKARQGRLENRVKTISSCREVDLHPDMAKLLKDFIGTRTSGLVFQTKSGKPLTLTNILRRHLHPALKKLGYVNQHTGNYKAGSHAFRRFRNTYLKNETACPKGLRDYWLAHRGDSMDDLYDKVKHNVALRKKWAVECGVGFEVPGSVSVVPNVPKRRLKAKCAKAM